LDLTANEAPDTGISRVRKFWKRGGFVFALFSAFPFIGAIMMFLIGAITTIRAGILLVAQYSYEGMEKEIMIYLIESIDYFLFALVLLIFSYGIYDLFIVSGHIDLSTREGLRPDWLVFNNIKMLKQTLVEVIIIILVINFFEMIVTRFSNQISTPLEILIIPLGILLIAGSLKLIRDSEG
jgi:uncharacterized membrane protein YqhA